jgi:hypothetical protein
VIVASFILSLLAITITLGVVGRGGFMDQKIEEALKKAETAHVSIAADLSRVSAELVADAKKIAELLASAGVADPELVARLEAHAIALSESAAALHSVADAHVADTQPAPAPTADPAPVAPPAS